MIYYYMQYYNLGKMYIPHRPAGGKLPDIFHVFYTTILTDFLQQQQNDIDRKLNVSSFKLL